MICSKQINNRDFYLGDKLRRETAAIRLPVSKQAGLLLID
jgi:hypothetical protein